MPPGVREIFIVTGFAPRRSRIISATVPNGSARIAYGRQVVQDGTGKAPELARILSARRLHSDLRRYSRETRDLSADDPPLQRGLFLRRHHRHRQART